MDEITATDAARNFSDLLDAVEHRGSRFTVLRRGRAVATLAPVATGGGEAAKRVLERHRADPGWCSELGEVRDLLDLDRR